MTRHARAELRSIEQGYHFDVETDGVHLQLDTNHERGMMSPMQTVLAAVGGCTAMDVIGILRKMRQHVTGYTVEVNAERRDEHPRIYTSIEVVHRVRGHDLRMSAVEEAVRLSDEKYCSVHAMLAPTVEMTSRCEIEEDSAPASVSGSQAARA